MGRRRKKFSKLKKENAMFKGKDTLEYDMDKILLRQCAKSKSRINKKKKKQLLKLELNKNLYRKPPSKKVKDHKNNYWQEIKVSGGNKVTKLFLFESIGNYVDVEFTPMGYHKTNSFASFYLDSNEKASSAIRALNRRVVSPEGEPMKIAVTKLNGNPDLIMNSNQLNIMKEVITMRFNESSGLLNLAHFHLDPVLLENNALVLLSSSLIMKQVLKGIQERASTVSALDLSKNKLDDNCVQAILAALLEIAPGLHAICLEDNFIKHEQCLTILKTANIKEINLRGNPLHNRLCKNNTQYIAAILDLIPSLIKLDGIKITIHEPPQTSSKSTSINPGTTLAIPNLQVSKEMFNAFLDQYYVLIDSTDRPKLIQAYSPEARVEFHSNSPDYPTGTFTGCDQIQQLLEHYPCTSHLHSTLQYTYNITEASQCQAVIKGKVIVNQGEQRDFMRQMILIPFNAGLCCSSDIFQIL